MQPGQSSSRALALLVSGSGSIPDTKYSPEYHQYRNTELSMREAF